MEFMFTFKTELKFASLYTGNEYIIQIFFFPLSFSTKGPREPKKTKYYDLTEEKKKTTTFFQHSVHQGNSEEKMSW